MCVWRGGEEAEKKTQVRTLHDTKEERIVVGQRERERDIYIYMIAAGI